MCWNFRKKEKRKGRHQRYAFIVEKKTLNTTPIINRLKAYIIDNSMMTRIHMTLVLYYIDDHDLTLCLYLIESALSFE